MRWQDLELESELSQWRIPAAYTKNGEVHIVPLAPQVVEIIRRLPQRSNCQWVFTTDGKRPISGFSKLKTALDAQLEILEPWRLHDLRRTCATGMGNMGVARHVVEAALNHVSRRKGRRIGAVQ